MADLKIKAGAGSTNKLLIQSQDQTGSNYAIQVGDAGATTLTNATLTTATMSAGSIGSAVTGFTGIKDIDTWRIHTTLNDYSGAVTANWERDDVAMGGSQTHTVMGTGMTQASGIFSFPSTGIWWINAFGYIGNGVTGDYAGWNIDLSVDNFSNYYFGGESYCHTTGNGQHSATNCQCFFDVTNVSTHKCRVRMGGAQSGPQWHGSTGSNKSGITFVRIGDT